MSTDSAAAWCICAIAWRHDAPVSRNFPKFPAVVGELETVFLMLRRGFLLSIVQWVARCALKTPSPLHERECVEKGDFCWVFGFFGGRKKRLFASICVKWLRDEIPGGRAGPGFASISVNWPRDDAPGGSPVPRGAVDLMDLDMDTPSFILDFGFLIFDCPFPSRCGFGREPRMGSIAFI
jgi:hypothetical protein